MACKWPCWPLSHIHVFAQSGGCNRTTLSDVCMASRDGRNATLRGADAHCSNQTRDVVSADFGDPWSRQCGLAGIEEPPIIDRGYRRLQRWHLQGQKETQNKRIREPTEEAFLGSLGAPIDLVHEGYVVEFRYKGVVVSARKYLKAASVLLEGFVAVYGFVVGVELERNCSP